MPMLITVSAISSSTSPNPPSSRTRIAISGSSRRGSRGRTRSGSRSCAPGPRSAAPLRAFERARVDDVVARAERLAGRRVEHGDRARPPAPAPRSRPAPHRRGPRPCGSTRGRRSSRAPRPRSARTACRRRCGRGAAPGRQRRAADAARACRTVLANGSRAPARAGDGEPACGSLSASARAAKGSTNGSAADSRAPGSSSAVGAAGIAGAGAATGVSEPPNSSSIFGPWIRSRIASTPRPPNANIFCRRCFFAAAAVARRFAFLPAAVLTGWRPPRRWAPPERRALPPPRPAPRRCPERRRRSPSASPGRRCSVVSPPENWIESTPKSRPDASTLSSLTSAPARRSRRNSRIPK